MKIKFDVDINVKNLARRLGFSLQNVSDEQINKIAKIAEKEAKKEMKSKRSEIEKRAIESVKKSFKTF